MPTWRPAGRADAIAWLRGGGARQSAALLDARRSSTAASSAGTTRRSAYEQALQVSPRSFDLRVRYASMLMNAGGAEQRAARRATCCAKRSRCAAPTSARCTCCRRPSARRTTSTRPRATARQLIAQNAKNPRGYYALAEALEERQRYQDGRRRAGARRRRSSAAARTPAFALGDAAAASGLRVPAAGRVRQGDCDLRGSAEARPERPDGDRVPDSGAAVGQALRRRPIDLAQAARTRIPTRPAVRAARVAGAARERQGRSGAGRAARTSLQQKPRRSAGAHRAGAGLRRRESRRRRP